MPQKPADLDPAENALAFFGAELRHHRSRARMSQDLLGDRVYCSGSLIGLIETARRMPTLDFARRCDEVLGTGGVLARLWPLVGKESHPSWFKPFVEVEERASSIREWEPLMVPGLLQTEDYARALVTAWQPGDGAGIIDQRVAARTERQQILSRTAPPLLWTIIGEAALRARVGGAKVMADQLAHLLDAASGNPRIIVQIVPLAAPAHPGMEGSFELVSREGESDIAYLEVQGKAHLVERSEDVQRYGLLYDMLRAVALSPDASYDLMDRLAKEEHP